MGRQDVVATADELLCATAAAAMPQRWQPGYLFALRQQPGGGGALLAGACSDGAVRFWGATGGALQPLWGRRLHAGIAGACAFTADGARLVSISKAGEIVVLVRAISESSNGAGSGKEGGLSVQALEQGSLCGSDDRCLG